MTYLGTDRSYKAMVQYLMKHRVPNVPVHVCVHIHMNQNRLEPYEMLPFIYISMVIHCDCY